MSLVQRLIADSASLGVGLSGSGAERLLRLLEELERWNRRYNLTAIRNREAMFTHHLLDSLSIHPDLSGTSVADVGTGAGFPGLPLAVANPTRRFVLIDSSGKKIRFVQHAARKLRLDNVEAMHTRVEMLNVERPFDTVVARAVAALPELIRQVAHLCDPDTHVLAMKGRWPQQEIEALPPGWRQSGSRELKVPGLEGARCVIGLRVEGPASEKWPPRP